MAEEQQEADPLDITAAPVDLDNEKRAKAIRAYVENRQRAYINVFREGKPSAEDLALVMDDLTRFCRGGQTPWADDPRIHALLTGRNEVWQRIRQQLDLPFAALLELYTTAPPLQENRK